MALDIGTLDLKEADPPVELWFRAMDCHVSLVSEFMEYSEFRVRVHRAQEFLGRAHSRRPASFSGTAVLNNTGLDSDGYSWSDVLVLSPLHQLLHQLTADLGVRQRRRAFHISFRSCSPQERVWL